MHLRTILMAALLICSASYSDYAPNIPLNVDVNQLVYRLASRYGLKIPENQFFQPLNYAVLREFLDTVSMVHGDKLSLTEHFL